VRPLLWRVISQEGFLTYRTLIRPIVHPTAGPQNAVKEQLAFRFLAPQEGLEPPSSGPEPDVTAIELPGKIFRESRENRTLKAEATVLQTAVANQYLPHSHGGHVIPHP
jgi:hypothetical protein